MQNANETLLQAAQEARRAYDRAWAKKNREKRRASQKRYWERKALGLVGRKGI